MHMQACKAERCTHISLTRIHSVLVTYTHIHIHIHIQIHIYLDVYTLNPTRQVCQDPKDTTGFTMQSVGSQVGEAACKFARLCDCRRLLPVARLCLWSKASALKPGGEFACAPEQTNVRPVSAACNSVHAAIWPMPAGGSPDREKKILINADACQPALPAPPCRYSCRWTRGARVERWKGPAGGEEWGEGGGCKSVQGQC